MNFFNKFNNLKNKNLKTNITKILSITTFGLLFIIMGSSYAYLTSSTSGTLINTLSSGNLELKLDNETSTLSLNKAVPQLDEDALENNSEYTFTLSNIGDVLTHYEIYLNNVCSTSETYIVNEESIKPDLCVDEKYIKVGISINSGDYTILNFENNKATLDMGEIWPEEKINYTVKIWLDKDTPNDYNAYLDGVERNVLFVSKINVVGEQKEYRDPEGAYYQIKSQVKQTAISYKYINDANVTENGITYNNGDNGVFLFDGTDDNGGDYPIYYYRGNVTNNNVLFANMCWKIVRTTSTGGTKLIYNGVPTDGACNNTGTSSELTGSAMFNIDSTSPAYVGYMYGKVYRYSSKSMTNIFDEIIYGNDVTYSNGTYTLKDTKTSTSWSNDRTTLANGYHYTCFNTTGTCTSVYYITYFGNSSNAYYLTFTEGDNLDTAKEKMYANTTNSFIKTNIDNWYSRNLISYTNMLENTIFCNDRTDAITEAYSGPLASKDTNSTSYSYFKSYENMRNGTPSLQCENQNDRFSLSTSNGGTINYGNNALTYPVGLLTSDEVMLAGRCSSNSYLHSGEGFLLLSPASWLGFRAGVECADKESCTTDSEYNGDRPVISLKLGTTFKSDTDGTASNPYIVE